MPRPYLVAGVGNIFYADDAAGIEALGYLRGRLDRERFELLEFSTKSIDILNYAKDYRIIFIIDALNFKKPPGSVKMFDLTNIKFAVRNNKISSHGLKLSDLLKLHRALKIKSKIYVIGVQPKEIFFRQGLSREVLESFPKISSEIEKLISFYPEN